MPGHEYSSLMPGETPTHCFLPKRKKSDKKTLKFLAQKKNSGNFCTSGRVCTEQFYRLHDLSGPSHHI